MSTSKIEIVPAILRRNYEGIVEDWQKVYRAVNHIQLDVTDGIFAGDGTFREIRTFKQLPGSEKIELHMMVQQPELYIDSISDLAPARCVFHLEAFTGRENITTFYESLHKRTPQTELGLALNPQSPAQRLEEHLDSINYVLFMGYNPGFAGQDIQPEVFRKIASFHAQNPDVRIAVDGHVDKETIPDFVASGATILCANSSVFKYGDPIENIEQLRLIAHAAAM